MKMRVRLKDGKLMDVFAAYRACKKLLAREFIAHSRKLSAMPGYEHAMDPDLIRAMRVYGAPPPWPERLFSEEREWLEYLMWVDDRVDRLGGLSRDIIRVQYLGDKVLGGAEVVRLLLRAGYGVTLHDIERERCLAFARLEKFFLA